MFNPVLLSIQHLLIQVGLTIFLFIDGFALHIITSTWVSRFIHHSNRNIQLTNCGFLFLFSITVVL